jgi:hypothetical protein
MAMAPPLGYSHMLSPLGESAKERQSWLNATRDAVPEIMEVHNEHEALCRQMFYEQEEAEANRGKKKRKPARKRKKSTQKKIRQHLVKPAKSRKGPITKDPHKPAHRKKTTRNYQGFSVDNCIIVNGKPHYRPPGYAEEWEEGELEDEDHCRHCRLQPCLLLGRRHVLLEEAKRIKQDQEDMDPEWAHRPTETTYPVMNRRLMTEVVGGMMKTLFSARYVEKFGLPKCCTRKVDQSYPLDGKRKRRLSIEECHDIMANADEEDRKEDEAFEEICRLRRESDLKLGRV